MGVANNTKPCECSRVLILKTKESGCQLLDYTPKKSSYKLANSLIDTGFQTFSPNLQSLCKLSGDKHDIMIGYNIVFGLNLSANCATKISDAKADDKIWGFSIDKELNKNAALIHNFPSKFIKGNIEVQSSDLEISQ